MAHMIPGPRGAATGAAPRRLTPPWLARRRWNSQVARLALDTIVTAHSESTGWAMWTTGPAIRQPLDHPNPHATETAREFWARHRAGRVMVGDIELTRHTRATWPTATMRLAVDCDAIPTWERPLLPNPRDNLSGLKVGTRVTVWWLWSERDPNGTRCAVTGRVIDINPDHEEIAVGADTDDCVDVPIRLVTAAHVPTGQPVPLTAVAW
jgi:hypothetical protein